MNESVDNEALVIPSSMWVESCRQLTFGIGTIVLGQEFGTLDLFGLDELGITRLDDGHATQHLANESLRCACR
jgi:hypothetical protein